MMDVFKDVHASMMNWVHSNRSDDSELEDAMRVTRAIGRVSHKSMDDLSEALEALKNSDDSTWEDLYMNAEDKLAEAMAKFSR